MSWKLKVGNINIEFLSTKNGSLGVKFNSSKYSGHNEYYAPNFTSKKIPKYNPKKPQESFYDVRYVDEERKEHYRVDQITKKWYDKEKPEVMLSADEMKKQYPLTKEAKVISKQDINKLNLTNIAASDGYYLLPKKDYDNVKAYKKLIEYLGDDFVITSPIRLRVGSITGHNYAIFVDKSKNALVAMEVLVKKGMQEPPKV